ncbi:MAG: hydroxyacylglutathione hydrolase, partial [Xanthomonadales bacterium]|nr:hydroxyacylglutathione hydrolase [Xanthomonadales bacterium]
CNPFLRCDQPGVMAGIAAATGSMPSNRLDSFTRLRRLKDAFRA